MQTRHKKTAFRARKVTGTFQKQAPAAVSYFLCCAGESDFYVDCSQSPRFSFERRDRALCFTSPAWLIWNQDGRPYSIGKRLMRRCQGKKLWTVNKLLSSLRMQRRKQKTSARRLIFMRYNPPNQHPTLRGDGGRGEPYVYLYNTAVFLLFSRIVSRNYDHNCSICRF